MESEICGDVARLTCGERGRAAGRARVVESLKKASPLEERALEQRTASIAEGAVFAAPVMTLAQVPRAEKKDFYKNDLAPSTT